MHKFIIRYFVRDTTKSIYMYQTKTKSTQKVYYVKDLSPKTVHSVRERTDRGP